MAERMIMEEVACLFVEQYEAMFHKDYKVSDVNLIRKTANRGIMDLYHNLTVKMILDEKHE